MVFHKDLVPLSLRNFFQVIIANVLLLLSQLQSHASDFSMVLEFFTFNVVFLQIVMNYHYLFVAIFSAKICLFKIIKKLAIMHCQDLLGAIFLANIFKVNNEKR